MKRARIAGIGMYVPKNIVSNGDLAVVMDTSDEWIQERTGIRERRYATRFEDTTTTMAVEKGKVKEKDLICLAAFGSGFTWGSALLKW
jgi:3-oxoacyl-[acyl-carrier-protein] synthase-3